MEMQIHLYSDSVYRKKNVAVSEFNQELETMTQAMLTLAKHVDTQSISAPQLGINLRIISLGDIADQNPRLFINPEVLAMGEMEVVDMQCAAFPGVQMTVERPKYIKLQYVNTAGETQTIELNDKAAHQVYHHIDILNNKLLTDNLSKLKRERFLKKYDKYLEHQFEHAHEHGDEGHVHGPNCQHHH